VTFLLCAYCYTHFSQHSEFFYYCVTLHKEKRRRKIWRKKVQKELSVLSTTFQWLFILQWYEDTSKPIFSATYFLCIKFISAFAYFFFVCVHRRYFIATFISLSIRTLFFWATLHGKIILVHLLSSKNHHDMLSSVTSLASSQSHDATCNHPHTITVHSL